MHFLVNSETNNVLQEVRLGRRVRVDAIKRSVTVTETGQIWPDVPYEIVDGIRDDSVPISHKIIGRTLKFDGERVVVSRKTVAMTAEEIAEGELQAAKRELADTDLRMARVGEEAIAKSDRLIELLVLKGTITRREADGLLADIPAESRKLLADRRALRARLIRS